MLYAIELRQDGDIKDKKYYLCSETEKEDNLTFFVTAYGIEQNIYENRLPLLFPTRLIARIKVKYLEANKTLKINHYSVVRWEDISTFEKHYYGEKSKI